MKLQQNFIMLNSVVYYSLIFNFYFSLRFSSGKRSVSLHLNNEERHFDEWKVNITKNVFIKKTIRNGKQSRKITPHIDDNSVYVDGIIHSEIKNQSIDWPKIKLIEKRFKNMLAMKGVKLIYKRDMFWRTWRVVSFSDNSKRTVYYKCTHIINSNCSDCFSGGFWIIEEDQIKCPYEIYSMVNKNQICIANYSQMEKIHEKCPSVASLTDLVISCGNPIKTMYRVTKTLSHFISERNQTDICGGREYCGISTFYRINEDYITFRILDSSNDIIFSKIMKPDMKNFACVTNCGRLDPITNIVSKSDQNITNNVSKSAQKEKNIKNIVSKSDQKEKKYDANKKHRDSGKKNNAEPIHPFRRNNIRKDVPSFHLAMTTTPPCCRKLQTTTEDYDGENYDDFSIYDN